MINTHEYTYDDSIVETLKSFCNLPYNLVIELPHGSQGGDGLLVYKLKK